jgi:hypothetical protein
MGFQSFVVEVRAELEAEPFLSARFCDNTVYMKRQTVITKKRRGPPPTGKGTLIGVRMQPDELAALDTWVVGDGRSLTRPEAIRRLVELGLSVDKPLAQTSARKAAKAKRLAGQAIDGMADPKASVDEKASRKRRLMSGPEEFREDRVDLQKAKK